MKKLSPILLIAGGIMCEPPLAILMMSLTLRQLYIKEVEPRHLPYRMRSR